MTLDPILTAPSAPLADGPGPHVVVIGGGASGVLMAAHLLRDPQGQARVTIIEGRHMLGCGIAYSTDDPDHLLNTRAISMSAIIIHRDRYIPSSPHRPLLYTTAAASNLYLLIHFDVEPWAHLLCGAAFFLHIAITALCRRYMYRRITRHMYDRVPGRRSGLMMRVKIPRGW